MNDAALKKLLLGGDAKFWDLLATLTAEAAGFDELFRLSALRRKAHARGLTQPGLVLDKVRLAIVGGYSFYPFSDLVEHLGETQGSPCELWLGDFDNYISEIMDDTSGLYAFKPQIVLLIPSAQRCK